MENKKSPEIVIGPRAIIIGILLFIVLAVAISLLAPKVGLLFQQPTPTVEIIPQVEAAKIGAQVFFSFNADLGQNAWIGDVCNVSNEEGCVLASKLYAPMIWPGIEKSGIKLDCQAQNAAFRETVEDSSEVWLVTMACTNLDTGLVQTDNATVIVAETVEGWKMLRIAFEQENQSEVQDEK